jgi:polyhydroxybutyrate depolymerase
MLEGPIVPRKPRKLKRILLLIAGVVVGLPVLVLLVVVVWIALLDRTNGTIVSSGEEREYLLHVPDSYDPATPTPLVISLHAGATWPAHQMNLSRWNRLADQNGFIVVYPSGTPQLLGAARIWRTMPRHVMTDVRFVSALIDTLAAAYNIDPARIYANGMSNGGGMVFALSCTLSDRLAAVGLVAAAQQLAPGWCAEGQPMPLIAFHGNADQLVPYNGGPLGDPFNPVKPVYPAVRDWVAAWAERNRCAGGPIESAIAADVTRIEYQDCADGASVVLYTLLGGGHSWPGGKPPPRWRVGATNTSIDATAEMWEFFLQHRLGMMRPPD